MIFVAVGTQKFPFDRLLKGIDDLIEQGQLESDVFAQIGHTDYAPRNYRYQNFLTKDDFQSYISSCDVLITHSGVATIIAGMKLEKPVVVVPRFAKFGEHVDDHQFQIAESFSDKNLVLMCKHMDKLAQTVQEAKTHSFSKYVSQQERMIHTIRDYLENI